MGGQGSPPPPFVMHHKATELIKHTALSLTMEGFDLAHPYMFVCPLNDGATQCRISP